MSDPVRLVNGSDGKLLVIQTRRLSMRFLTAEDITDDYIEWLNNREINKYLEIRFFKHTRKTVEAYIMNCNSDLDSIHHFGVFHEGGVRHVGTVTVNNINLHHLSASLSVVIGHPKAQRKGYGTEAVHGVLYYLFKKKHIKKVYAGYYEDNLASARVFEKNGFSIEGRISKKFVNYKGQRVDHIYVGLLSDHFRPNKYMLGLN